MPKTKRRISLGLFFILCCASVKFLFLDLQQIQHTNCDEFGHLHLVKMNTSLAIKSIVSFQDQDDPEDCHEGKSSGGATQLPVRDFQIQPVLSLRINDLVFLVENFFQSPIIEPLRKPPKQLFI